MPKDTLIAAPSDITGMIIGGGGVEYSYIHVQISELDRISTDQETQLPTHQPYLHQAHMSKTVVINYDNSLSLFYSCVISANEFGNRKLRFLIHVY